MPRDLSDVLHYFLPELERSPSPAEGVAPRSARRRTQSSDPATTRPPLSVLCVPIGERDLVHAAFTWSLAVETARLGGSVAVVAPENDRHTPLWSTPGTAIEDPELVYCRVDSLAELPRSAEEIAAKRSRTARQGGVVFARIPPPWLDAAADRADSIRWVLMFSSPRREDTTATFERIERMLKQRPGLEIGVTIHGVRRISEARDAFDELARRCKDRLGLALASYGLLTDDLDVYRAIAAGRSIGETHPHSPAARALADVARLVFEDARSRVLG